MENEASWERSSYVLDYPFPAPVAKVLGGFDQTPGIRLATSYFLETSP